MGYIFAAVILSACKFDSLARVWVALVDPPEEARVEVIPSIGVSELGFLKLFTTTVNLLLFEVTTRVIVTMLALMVQVGIEMPDVDYICSSYIK